MVKEIPTDQIGSLRRKVRLAWWMACRLVRP